MTKQEFVDHMDDVYPKIQESLKSGKKTCELSRRHKSSAAAIAYWASICFTNILKFPEHV